MKTRHYHSELRARQASERRRAILTAAHGSFSQRGIDRVTVAEIAALAGVAASTVYAAFGSKEGLLAELMRAALFGPRFEAARARLDAEPDPVEAIRLTASVARAVYEGEHEQLGLLRGASAFAPSLAQIEHQFEQTRYEMQRERVERLHHAGRLSAQLSLDEARRVLWALTNRELYRSLVGVAGWSPDRYEGWLGHTLVAQLVAESPQ
ncbi:MAG: helix-turn-helix domain-containing protein [Myxococcota bacterium]